MLTNPKSSVYLLPISVVLGCCLTAWKQFTSTQNNTPPKVVITKPSAQERFDWNATIPYNISVEDKEDGLSKYDEIAANEVFLKVRFVPDSNRVKSYLANEKKLAEPGALTLIKTSDCFNCHAMKSKLMGPSFESIARRYTNNTGSVTKLATIIIKGSEKVSGTEKMPAHPQIKQDKAREIVRWILSNGADPNVDYVRGLQGAFRTRQKPAGNSDKAVYVLTASYRDHGLPGTGQQQKEGKHVFVLKSN